jgi:hypothetical protein
MDLKGDVLLNELNSWSRLDLIEWLLSDSNGVYKDEESLAEFDNISKRRSYRNNDKTITTLNLVLKKKHLNGSFFSINPSS